MSTPETLSGNWGPPQEAALAAQQLPTQPALPATPPLASPGVGPGVLRFPGGPSFDFDPTLLANALIAMVNPMQQTPPAGGAPPGGAEPPSLVPLTTAPAAAAPVTAAPAAPAPTAPVSVAPTTAVPPVVAAPAPHLADAPVWSAQLLSGGVSSHPDDPWSGVGVGADAQRWNVVDTAASEQPYFVPTTPSAGEETGAAAASLASPTHAGTQDTDLLRLPQSSVPFGEAPSLPSPADLGPLGVDLGALSAPARDDGSAPASATQEGHQPYFLLANNAQATEAKTPLPVGAYQLNTLVPVRSLGAQAFDPYAVRAEFPILRETVRGKRLVWLDNAATTQKPQAVIDRISYFYEHENSNIHRAAHTLAARATDAYERARESVRRFINAPSVADIVFVRGATEGINLIAQTYGWQNVGQGDEVVITWLEHHANIVPWQMLCADKGARLRVAPVDDRGQVRLDEYQKLLGPKTKIVSLTVVSNALGTVTPTQEMVAMAHRYGARVVVDGAQSVSHRHTDVQELDADFFVFSGHKVFAPTGIGVVYGKQNVLADMLPYQGGGNMIADVTFDRTVYQPPPARFEAGTGNIADAVGLGAALDWVSKLGLHNVERYEHDLLEYGTERLLTVPGLKLIGAAQEKAGVLSFVLDGQRTEDVGAMLDKEGIAVRSGHHCAQPILRRFGLEATVRASLAPYNVCEDIDALVEALHRIQARRG